ncbi:MAG TPA: PIG-L family deacetylase [Actinomycetota bacterium]|nr:PIG-L family deacetylase [Actinomycetota bacterium]
MRGRPEELGTILGVWAHPDDETYLSAGLMAAAARAGSRVIDVTATRGEGGSMDEERWPPEKMGEVREQELIRSLETLGVSEHYWLDLPDVDMDSSLPEVGARRVSRLMEKISPDTVLTFGPEGMTGHEGHKSVCRWATEAFHRAAEPGARLYYATYTPELAEEWVPKLERFDIFRPGTPPVTPRDELAICYTLPTDVLELKVKAIRQHESQIEALLHVFGEEGFGRVMAEEYFVLAAETPA